MQQEIQELATGRVELRVACAYGTMHILYPFIQQFYRKHPEIWITWMEYTDLETDQLLQNGEVDLAFCVEGEGQEAFKMLPLLRQKIMVLVYEGHPFWNRDSIEMRDLKGERIVMEGSRFHIFSLFQEKCLEAGFYPNIVAQTTEVSLCHNLCRMKEGLGITIDFRAVGNDTTGMKAVPLRTPGLDWKVSLAVRKDKKTRPAAEKFYDFMKIVSPPQNR